jgi:tRNA threonylcarbamoyladenosine biosynthesis protein TsaB
VVLATEDGAVIDQREMPGGELDTRLPGVLTELGGGDLTAVVVLTGPGSYSGVRAGMAAALGLALARAIPLHGLGNLAAVAAAVPRDGADFTVVSDAGRGGVYAAQFSGRAPREQLSPVQRFSADRVDARSRLFACAEIAGLAAEQLEPLRVLAAAVPHALALPPLDAVGLCAIHAESPATTG